MRIVTYNIQYGVGLDGNYDPERIAHAVRGADLIALQEATRNNPQNGGADLVSALRELLPDYFGVFGAPFSADMGSRIENGRALDTRFEFGNMVLSRTPIMMSRTLTLPRRRSYQRLNLQRCAVEALVETPLGPIRFYSVHLDHTSPDEREAQLRFLMQRVAGYGLEGGALSGVSEMGFPEPPHPESFVLLGDFNMLAGSAEYLVVTGAPDHEVGTPLRAGRGVDAARIVGAEAISWVDPKRPEDPGRHKRIDYVFVSPDLAPRVKTLSVDTAATGSDHKPVWLELA